MCVYVCVYIAIILQMKKCIFGKMLDPQTPRPPSSVWCGVSVCAYVWWLCVWFVVWWVQSKIPHSADYSTLKVKREAALRNFAKGPSFVVHTERCQ